MYDLWVHYTDLNGRFYKFKSLYKSKYPILWIRFHERNEDYDDYSLITTMELILLRFRINFNSLYVNTEIIDSCFIHNIKAIVNFTREGIIKNEFV